MGIHMLLDEGGTVILAISSMSSRFLADSFAAFSYGEQVFHLVDVVNQIRLILCSYGDNVVHGQISEHAGFNLYFLGVHFPFHPLRASSSFFVMTPMDWNIRMLSCFR